MKTVFILGAGASVEAGAPIMRNFLETARRLRREERLTDCGPQIDDIIRAADEDLQALYAKSNLDVENIEDLFSAIAMGRLIGKYGDRRQEDIDRLYESMVTFIFRVLEETIRLPVKGDTATPPTAYDVFTKQIAEHLERRPANGASVSIITLNYDTALDFTLRYNNLLPDYRLGHPMIDEQAHYAAKIPVLKLHGSINWSKCPTCNQLVATTATMPNINPAAYFYARATNSQPLEYKLPHGSSLNRYQHGDGHMLSKMPYLVPPTWNKTVDTPELQNVWRTAAFVLSEATKIVIIGFSMPETDRFFRYLFALGLMSKTKLRKVLVIDPDPNVRQRFQDLTGKLTAARFEFVSSKFGEAVGYTKIALDT